MDGSACMHRERTLYVTVECCGFPPVLALIAIWSQVYAWACEVAPIWSVIVWPTSQASGSRFFLLFFSCLMIIISQRGRCRRCSFKHSVLSCPANRCLFYWYFKVYHITCVLSGSFYQGCVLAPGECCLAVLVPLITCISFFFLFFFYWWRQLNLVTSFCIPFTHRHSLGSALVADWKYKANDLWLRVFIKTMRNFFSGNIVVFLNKRNRHIW